MFTNGSFGEYPYNEYKVYKQFHKKTGRYQAHLYKSEDDRTSVSWARYILSVHLGRIIGPEFEVDHKDENKTNDAVENLQILTRAEHKEKTPNKGRTMVELICPECSIKFKRERRQTHLVKGGNPTFCSNRCRGVNSARKRWG